MNRKSIMGKGFGQAGFAALPLIVVLAALAGLLTGTAVVQRSTQQTFPKAQELTIQTDPTPTPVPCDNSNPDHICGGSLTVRAFVEDQQCSSSGKESVDTWITNINSENSAVEFKYFNKSAESEEKELTSSGAVNFQNFNYVPDENYYNNETDAIYKYPQWVRISGQQVAIRPCSNQRGENNSSENTFTRVLEPDDFQSGDNYYWEIRFEKTGVVQPTATPTITPTPNPNQCPAQPNLLNGKELNNCDPQKTRPDNVEIELTDWNPWDPGTPLSDWNGEVKVSWDGVSADDLSVYRVAVFYYVDNERGILAGWPDILQVDKETDELIISGFNRNGTDGPLEHVLTAAQSGADVQLAGVVRAIYSKDPDESLDGKSGDDINKLCFCRSDKKISERRDVPVQPEPTTTITPTPTGEPASRTLQFDIQDKNKNGDDRQCWIIWREEPNGEEPENFGRCKAKGNDENVYSGCDNDNMGPNLDFDCGDSANSHLVTPNVDANGNLVGLETTLKLDESVGENIAIKMMTYVCDDVQETCQDNERYGDSGESTITGGQSYTCRWENPGMNSRNVSCEIDGTVGPLPTAIPTQSPTNTPSPTPTTGPTLTPAITPTLTPSPTPASNGTIQGSLTVITPDNQDADDIWDEHKIWYGIEGSGNANWVNPANGAAGGNYTINNLLINQLYSVVVSSKHKTIGWLDSTQKRFVKPQADGRLIVENGSYANSLDFTINPPVEEGDEQGTGINGTVTLINSDQNIDYDKAFIEFFNWNGENIEKIGHIEQSLQDSSREARVNFEYDSASQNFVINNGSTYGVRVVVINQRGYYVAVTPHKVVNAPKADLDFEIEIVNVHSGALSGIGDYFIYFIDVVLDGFINTKDYDSIVRTYGVCKGRPDVNSDGVCNGIDLSHVIYNIGRQVEISSLSPAAQLPISTKIRLVK